MADIRKFKPEIVAEVNRLLGHHRDQEIADILNCRGLKTGEGKRFQRELRSPVFVKAMICPVTMSAFACAVCSRRGNWLTIFRRGRQI